MNIILNGKDFEINDGITISELLKLKKIRPEVVTVEVNEKIVERSKYASEILNEADAVEFVYFMGGGK